MKGAIYEKIKSCWGGGNRLSSCIKGFTLAGGATHRDPAFRLSIEKKGDTFGIRRCAFTLAEVLITLGIIGIVAAMTMPSLIAKHQEKQWVTSYLRVYSLLENAYRMVQNEDGTYENWSGVTITTNKDDGKPDRDNADTTALYNFMIKPYFQLNGTFLKGSRGNCMPEKSYELDGQAYTTNFDGELINGKYTAVSLVSGECIALGHAFGDFFVDLNGKKRPNTLGKDQFVFSFDVMKPERIKPGSPSRWWTDTANYCDVSSKHGWHAGMSCGFWIVRNHNMDYLHMQFDELKQKWSGGVW